LLRSNQELSRGGGKSTLSFGGFNPTARERKRLSGLKIAIIERHLGGGVPISDLRDEDGLQPSHIYRWQAAIFAHGVSCALATRCEFALNQDTFPLPLPRPVKTASQPPAITTPRR